MNIFLSQESDAEIDGILMLVKDDAEKSGIKIRSAKSFMSMTDALLYIPVAKVLLELLKSMIDILPKSKQEVDDVELANNAREKLKIECERVGLDDCHLEELKISSVKNRKGVTGILRCQYFRANVAIDDLGNVIFTKVLPLKSEN